MQKVTAFYPSSTDLKSDEVKSAWFEVLKNVPYEYAMANIAAHVMSSRFPPAICDIVGQAGRPAPKDANKAWQQVLSAVGHYGIYREIEAMDSLPEDVREAVRDVGFRNICMATEADAKKMFVSAYKELNNGGTQLANVR